MDLMIDFNIREVWVAQFQSYSLSDVSSLPFLILFNDFSGEFRENEQQYIIVEF